MARHALALYALVLACVAAGASARTLLAQTAAHQSPARPEFVFSNELLEQAAKKAQGTTPPPAPQPTPGGRAGARVIPPEEVGCLHNVAPAPLNWTMWCAGENATVREYVDKAGAMHKIITFAPQPGLTPEMAIFYQSGSFPLNVDVNGKNFFWYHLWHPIDHIYSENQVRLNPFNPFLPNVKTLIHEAYRNDPGKVALSTKMWVDVLDVQRNVARNRTLAGLKYNGITVWQLLVTYKDTPKGCAIETEYVLGVPEKGWDPMNPKDGYEPAAGRTINSKTAAAFLAPYRTDDMFKLSDKAVTRHTIEEFSNLGKFLPQVWNDPAVVAARSSLFNPLPMMRMMGRLPGTRAL